MENASKALLIAGSILVVILLIAMGVSVFNSTSGTTDSVEGTMQSTEIATYNNKFTQYAGSNKSKAQVMSLLNVVIANNATSNHTVNVNGSDSVQAMINTLTDKQYTIEIADYTEGYISNIKIY